MFKTKYFSFLIIFLFIVSSLYLYNLYIEKDNILKLINQLASELEDPNPNNEHFIQIAEEHDPWNPNYNLSVMKAKEKLTKLGLKAFPYLINNSNDQRFSQTIMTSIYSSFSVGEICISIIGKQINSIPNRKGYKGMPNYTFSVIQQNPKKWWKEHSGKSILELKKIVLIWTIQQEKENFKNIGKTLSATEEVWNKKIIEPLKSHLKSLPQT